MTYVEVKLFKCQNGSNPANVTCQNPLVIDNFIASQTFSFAFVNAIFSQESYPNPVAPFIDDELFFALDPTRSKTANILVQESSATL